MRDLSDPYEADRRQQADVRRQKASTMLQNSSITQGGLRVASANGILAQSVAGGNPAVRVTGLQVVDGVLRITGTLEGSGSWSWTGSWEMSGDGDITGDVTATGTLTQNGPWNLNGAGTIAGNVTATGSLTQNGPWTLNGAGTIAGNVVQTGNTDQRGNVTVNGGGKIVVQGGGGNVVLDSSYGDPRITLGSAQINGGTNSFTFNSGAQIVYFVNNTIRIPGMATKPVGDVPGGYVGGVWVDLSGNFYRLS